LAALASEGATDVASTADNTPHQDSDSVRCSLCMKRYTTAAALKQHQENCTKHVFRDKSELIVAAIQEFFTSSKRMFAETRSRSTSNDPIPVYASPRRSRKNCADKETVNKFASFPPHLREHIQAFVTQEQKHGRKVKPQDVIAFMSESVLSPTDWEARYLLTEQRLKTEISRLVK
jgi:hypothetical protein